MIIEWAAFRVAKGATEEQLMQASRELQEGFLAKQRGFVRRELLRGADGQWVDLVYWESREAVDAAMQLAMSSPACHAYFKVMAAADHGDPGAGVLLFERGALYE